MSLFRPSRFIALASALLLSVPAFSGSNHLYGVHFYGGCGGQGAQNVMNGKAGYSVELEYLENRSDWTPLRNRVQAAKNAGFTPIVRLDWRPGQTVPANGDWNGRFYYAAKCREAAANVGDLCNIWIVGNEPNLSAEGAIPADWYLTVYSGTDANCALTQIKAARPGAVVLVAAVGVNNPDTDAPGPYDSTYERWKNYHYYLVQNVGNVDGFAIHCYSGRAGGQPGNGDFDPDPRDDSNYPSGRPADHIDQCWGFNSLAFFMGEIDRRFWNKPVYITETNTFLDPGGAPANSYRSGWMQKAYEAVDTWNKNHYHRINAFCWFVYGTGYGWDDFALQSECRSNMPSNLLQARNDLNWTTANKTYVNTAQAPDAYVYQIATNVSNPNVNDPNQIVFGNYIGPVAYSGADTAWGAGGPLGQGDYWVMVHSRMFYASTTGTYNFRTTSDDGSWLWVDGAIVVDNGGLHGPQTRTGSINLTAGYHWVYTKFFEWGGDANTGYQIQRPGTTTWTTINEGRPPKGNAVIYDINMAASNLSSNDMNAVVPGAYVDSMGWNGVFKDWGSGSPTNRIDNWMIMKPFLFYVAVPGTYQFRTGSDDGSWLWIDGQIVVYNHGLHGLVWAGGNKYLSRGWHTGFFKFFEATGGASAGFDYIPPNGPGWDVMFTY